MNAQPKAVNYVCEDYNEPTHTAENQKKMVLVRTFSPKTGFEKSVLLSLKKYTLTLNTLTIFVKNRCVCEKKQWKNPVISQSFLLVPQGGSSLDPQVTQRQAAFCFLRNGRVGIP